MNVRKCNKCKKLIKELHSSGIAVSVWGMESLSADLCSDCAAPFLKNFKKHARLSLVEKKLGIVSGK